MHASEAIKTLFSSTWQLKPWFHTFLIHPHLFNVAIKALVSHFFDPPASIQRGN